MTTGQLSQGLLLAQTHVPWQAVSAIQQGISEGLAYTLERITSVSGDLADRSLKSCPLRNRDASLQLEVGFQRHRWCP